MEEHTLQRFHVPNTPLKPAQTAGTKQEVKPVHVKCMGEGKDMGWSDSAADGADLWGILGPKAFPWKPTWLDELKQTNRGRTGGWRLSSTCPQLLMEATPGSRGAEVKASPLLRHGKRGIESFAWLWFRFGAANQFGVCLRAGAAPDGSTRLQWII